jgi:peptide subunit release factor 1 (eRF1)
MFDDLILLEPPSELCFKHFYYRCDKVFHLQDYCDLLDLSTNITSSIIVLTSATKTLFYKATVVNEKLHFTLVSKIDKYITGKCKAGGQSAQRFDRLFEEQMDAHAKMVIT